MTAPLPHLIRFRELLNHPAEGDKPATRGILPIAPAAFYRGMADGSFPRPVSLSPGVRVWLGADIQALVDRLQVESDRVNGRKEGGE